jgi:hypothetical protein
MIYTIQWRVYIKIPLDTYDNACLLNAQLYWPWTSEH